MAAIQGVFKRYEKKYLLTPEQYKIVLKCIEEHMEQDMYGLHTICNIYYDTDHFDLIRASIEKPLYKEKFRVRSYGVPGKEDQVFLEIKKKYDGIVYKRRIAAPLQNAQNYLQTEKEDAIGRTQILDEIDYMLHKVKPEPKVYIAYDRTAYYGKEDSELRVTFDTNMRFRDYDLDLAKGDYGKPILEGERYLMEVKLPGVMPLWMSHMFNDNNIFPTSFSKYGTCYTTDLIKKLEVQPVQQKITEASEEKNKEEKSVLKHTMEVKNV